MKDQEQLPVVRMDSPEAERLADLGSIFQDLSFTLDACERLVGELGREPADAVLVQSLWTAALISYVRCFASGKRLGLSEDDLAGLDGEPIAAHRFFKNLRDKHVAHSVSPFEDVAVGVILPSLAAGEGSIQGITTLAMRHIAPSRDGVRDLALLAQMLRKKVAVLAKEAEAATLSAARTIPLEQLRAREPLRLCAPGHEAAGEPRQKRDDA